jgi:hypothetical protein
MKKVILIVGVIIVITGIVFVWETFLRDEFRSVVESDVTVGDVLPLEASEVLQESVDSGRQPWRLDPVQVARSQGVELGFSEFDQFTLKSKEFGQNTGISVAEVEAVHADQQYIITLTQPVKTGEGGIWIVIHISEAVPEKEPESEPQQPVVPPAPPASTILSVSDVNTYRDTYAGERIRVRGKIHAYAYYYDRPCHVDEPPEVCNAPGFVGFQLADADGTATELLNIYKAAPDGTHKTFECVFVLPNSFDCGIYTPDSVMVVEGVFTKGQEPYQWVGLKPIKFRDIYYLLVE